MVEKKCDDSYTCINKLVNLILNPLVVNHEDDTSQQLVQQL